uniref:Uncharacterized protein n=1 Tax=Trichobilharzia regenti TaxID=157069 RepID=A0AA85J1X9_TRIRE
VAEDHQEAWVDYVAVSCWALIVLLSLLLFFKFRNNLPVALFLIGIIIVLWSANIFSMCCNKYEKNCFILLGFIVLEDLLTIVFCFFTYKRLKLKVIIVMMLLSTAFVITGIVLFFLGKDDPMFFEITGGFWNTALDMVAIGIASFLK